MNFFRMKNKGTAKIISYLPSISKILINSYTPWKSKDIPWTPVIKLLNDSKVAIVTTAGVHHRDQKPFDMNDPKGDPTFRVIDVKKGVSDLMITHDYYDHSDADRDINIVFPIERLREFESEGIIGKVTNKHYGFMGHIEGNHVQTLIDESSREVARRLQSDHIDIVLLTPG
jgi:D-proline reductase (dithiol) PrdB